MVLSNKITISIALLFFITGYSCTSQSTDQYIIKTNMGNMTIQLYDDTPKHTTNFKELVQDDFYDGVLFHRVINNFMIQTGDPDSKNAKEQQQLGTGGPGYTIEAEIQPHHFHKKGALAAARQSDQTNPERKSSGSQFYIVHGKQYTENELVTNMDSLQQYFKQYIQQPENKQLLNQVVKLQENKQYQQIEQLIHQYKDTLEAFYDKDFNRDYPEERLEAYTTQGGVPHLDDQYTVFGEVIKGFDVIDKIANQPTNNSNRPVKDIVILDIHPVK